MTEARDREAAPGDGGRDRATARRPPEKPPAALVFAPALGAFLAALALLAFQVRAGQDPALGPAEPVAQAQVKPRRVLVRKVIKRVVVHHPPAGSSSTAPAPAAVRTSAPQTTTAAPAPAPAPAPAAAPLTTQSS
jgi:hypothetical protein